MGPGGWYERGKEISDKKKKKSRKGDVGFCEDFRKKKFKEQSADKGYARSPGGGGKSLVG